MLKIDKIHKLALTNCVFTGILKQCKQKKGHEPCLRDEE